MNSEKVNQSNRNIGLYIHLPFCQRKCSYCGFLSLEGQSEEAIGEYIRNLLIESEIQVKELAEVQNRNRTQNRQNVVDTIYIGGGTPSLVNGKDMTTLLEGIRRIWPLDAAVEITMESNPNSFTAENLRSYKKAGINRLSIGIQSFDDGILAELGRLHDSKEALNAVQMAKESGFENINLDLMFGLPGQSIQQWQDTLVTAVSLEPTHLSLYTLQIEEGTKLYQDYKSGKLPVVDLTVDRACYHDAIEYLKQNSFNQYEISNFSKDGYACEHNIKYWSMNEFIGLGLNASSYVDGKRWRNLAELDKWATQIENCRIPFDSNSMHQETREDAMGTFMFTGLRKTTGVSFEDFQSRFGQDFFMAYSECLPQLQKYRDYGYIDWSETKTARLWITEKGIDHSNEIMSEFV